MFLSEPCVAGDLCATLGPEFSDSLPGTKRRRGCTAGSPSAEAADAAGLPPAGRSAHVRRLASEPRRILAARCEARRSLRCAQTKKTDVRRAVASASNSGALPAARLARAHSGRRAASRARTMYPPRLSPTLGCCRAWESCGGGGWGESARRGRIEERSRRTVVVDGDAGGEEHAALDRLGVVASQLDLSRGVGGHEGEGAPLEHVVACVVFDPGVGDGEEQRKREGRRRGPAAAAAAWHHGGDAAGRGRGGLVLDGHAEAHDAIDAVEVRAVTVCDGSELGVDIVVADLYHVSALVAFQVGIISVSEQEHLFGYNTECFTFQWIENGAISRVKRYFKAFSLCCCWAAIRQHLFSCLII